MSGDNYILAVDDETAVLELITNTLKREGFEVAVATEGKSALAMVNERIPGLIILDINMPGMDGLEVLKRIRENTNAPVIMLSVINDADTISEALTAGADDYMGKPFETRELVARVKVQLRHTGRA